LRLPDSGARDRAFALRGNRPSFYDTHFAILEMIATPVGAQAVTGDDFRRDREARAALLSALEDQWPTSTVSAYFYIAFGTNSAYFKEAKSALQKVVDAHPQHAAVPYRMLSNPAAYSSALAGELLSSEPRFAEVRLIIGQRALLNGNLEAARRELLLAREALPTSMAIAAALAPVEFAYAHYNEALSLYDEVLARGPDAVAQLGKAEALSYLKRHRDAIHELDDLLDDPSRNPGEKYYWRAWNKLQLAELEPAYEDATATLRFMNGPDAFRLAGIATFNLQRLPEARGYFESALKMYAADCDALQYIGQLDASERKWPAAAASFIKAANCFQESISRTSAELAKKEEGNAGGLLDAQIAILSSDLDAQRLLQAQSVQNAAVADKNASALKSPAR
jgi:tetratricopeptide (TPR) repeat protein